MELRLGFFSSLCLVQACLILSLVKADNLSTRLLLTSNATTPGERHSENYCAMNDICGKRSDDKVLNCPYGSPAVKPDDLLSSKIQSLCPTITGNVCCTEAQFDTLRTQVQQAIPFLVGCPACLRNFLNLFCELTCSPNQSLFINVTSVDKVGGNLTVGGIDYFVTDAFGEGLYESCKEVKFGTMNSRALQFIGGGAQNFKEWFAFIGRKAAPNTLGSPYAITFQPNATKSSGMKPMNVSSYSCGDISLGCSCGDCPSSSVCSNSASTTTHKRDSCSIKVGSLMVKCVDLILAVLYIVLVSVFLGWGFYNRIRERKPTYRTRPVSNVVSGGMLHSLGGEKDESLPMQMIEDVQQNRNEVRLSAVQGYMSIFYRKYGSYAAKNPITVLSSSLAIVLLLSLGLIRFKVETRPEKLWVGPGSKAAQEKQFFDSHLAPFYRIEQLILATVPDHVNSTSPRIVSEDNIKFLFEIQKKVDAIRANYSGLMVSLQDICMKPLDKDCATQSVLQYFKMDPKNFDDYGGVDHLNYCFEHYSSAERCMSAFKAPLDPSTVLGGFSGNDYSGASAFLVTYPVNNAIDEEGNETAKAVAWEKTFIQLVKDELLPMVQSRNLTLAFSSESSIEEELKRESTADAITILVSYLVMFAYISLTLGDTPHLSSFYISSKVLLGLAGIMLVMLSVLGSVGFFSALGVKSTLIIMEVIPFLVLAVGVDNMCILVHAVKRQQLELPLEGRISNALVEVGPSITLASLSEVLAFAVGSFIPMPACRVFSMFAALAVLLDFLLQVTAFVALIVLDSLRAEDKRVDCFPCIKVHSLHADFDKGIGQSKPGLLARYMKEVHAPILSIWGVKIVVIAIFTAFTLASIALSTRIEPGLEQEIVLPRDSYLQGYFNNVSEYLRIGPPLYFIVKNYNYSSESTHTNQLCSISQCNSDSLLNEIARAALVPDTSYIAKPAASWLDDFLVWVSPEAFGCCRKFTNGSYCPPDDQERGTGRMIGRGHESRGLYYLQSTPSLACIAADSPNLLHERLGHPSLFKLKQMVPSLDKIKTLTCESCQLGKHVRSSFPRQIEGRIDSPFSVIHSDIWGPSRVSSMDFRYFVTFIDEFSRCTWVFLMKERSELFSIFTSFLNEIKTQFGKTIKVLRSDNAKEYFSSNLSSFLSSQGILHQSTCPHTPQQNGIAERKNRHLVDTARTLLLHANVPVRHWGDAVLTACFLINRMPSSSLNNKVPHSILFPKEPLFHVAPRVFGCVCFVHDLSPGLDKLSARAIKCVFLGYSRLQKGYRCYSPIHNRYYVSADVTFFEDTLYFSSSMVESKAVHEVFPVPLLDLSPCLEEPISPMGSTEVAPSNSQPEPSQAPLIIYRRRPRAPNTVLEDPERRDASCPTPTTTPITDLPEENLGLPIALRKGTRSTRNPHPIYNFLSYHRLSPSYYSFVSTLSSVSIPKHVHEALAHPGWRLAMIDEMQALEHSGTWELVPLPSGKKPVGCRWVYAIKVGPDGQIDRLKARLVAKGYTQIYGLDYGDTFSPVAKITSVRLFLAMAAIYHWPLYQLDIKNAFLHGELEEEIYMEQPPGFVAQGESGLVCKLRRSLYGLKQSPRAWFGKFSSVVQAFGLKRSEADHSVFYCHTSSNKCVYLVVYVDDIVITGDDHERISQLKEHLFSHFQTKDLGKLKYFLGIEVAQSSNGITISQRKYALDILKETGMLACRPIDSPMDPNQKLLPSQGEPYSDPERYRRLVGKLIYLTITRPDISFAVGVVSQFMQSPHTDHWDAVIRILRYIKKSPGQGLLYEDKGNTQIVGYCDADWAGSPIDRRSTSGYCVSIGGNVVSWKSKKQNVVARSSAEAEYRAMATATCELIWIKQLLQELKFGDTKQMKLCCDNQAALHIASNPVFHERTKHIEIDCHFVREKVLSKEVITESVSSNDQLADIFTKSLRGPRIQYICSKLGAFDLYAPA